MICLLAVVDNCRDDSIIGGRKAQHTYFTNTNRHTTMHVGALWGESTADPASAQPVQSNASGRGQSQASLQTTSTEQSLRQTAEGEKESRADAAVPSGLAPDDDTAGSSGPSRLRLALSPNSRMYLSYLEEARRERMAWIAAVPVQAPPAVIGFDGKVCSSREQLGIIIFFYLFVFRS